ncbi:MAG TPA: hypothetical protein VMM60_06040 [Ilumatobacter sp.]|nr:hypothetical protein [Ilumatobacter sp.]
MSKRDALQEFLSEVVPAFREKNAWEDLAWNVINKLTEEQLVELKADFDNNLMIFSTDEWAV